MRTEAIFLFILGIILLLSITIVGCTTISKETLTKDGKEAPEEIVALSEHNNNTTPIFCNEGIPAGKCNSNLNSQNFYKFCNEQGVFVEDCTKCKCYDSIAQCNTNTKKCEINTSKRCPPYEEGCTINKELFSSCDQIQTTLKLKGDIKIGVVVLSQFTEKQFPQSYLLLIKGQLNTEEKNFFEKEDSLRNNLDKYQLSYINKWAKEQAKRITGDENFADLEFKFATKDVCYVKYEDYHQTLERGNTSPTGPSISSTTSSSSSDSSAVPVNTIPENNKLFMFIASNCIDGLDDADAILVLGFVLDGAETLKGNLGLGEHRGGIKTTINLNNKAIPLVLIDVTTLPPFCKKRDVAPSEKCQFPLGGSRSGEGCIELTCTREECCYNSQLPGCDKGCVPPTGITDINVLSTHELLHIFGVADHGFTDISGSSQLCVDLDTESIPLSLRSNPLTQCGGRTICSVCYSTGQLPLECAVITDKEARELGWKDNNNNGIVEVNE